MDHIIKTSPYRLLAIIANMFPGCRSLAAYRKQNMQFGIRGILQDQQLQLATLN
jgi:hypothetical protein